MKCRAVASLVIFAATASLAADWPQFLGPDRDGSSPETGLRSGSEPTRLKVLWKIPCGAGQSEVVVGGGRAYTSMQREGNEVAVAFDASTGVERWSRITGKGNAGPPSSTPAFDHGRIYVQGNRGLLLCLEADNGAVVWELNVLKAFDANVSMYGTTVSPLIDENLLITIVGANEAGVVALDKTTGKTVWKSTGDRRGFGSPIIMQVAGKKQVVCHTNGDVIALERDGGQLVWRVPWDDWGSGDAASPIAIGNRVFIASGADCAMFEPGATGAPRVVWRKSGKDSVMATWWTTAVCHDHYLYGFSGDSKENTSLNCVEAASGKLIWSSKKCDGGNLALADGKLYIVTLAGDLVVVPATLNGYEEKSRMNVLGKNDYINAPSIAGKKLYIRDSKNIVCVDLAGR